MNETQPKGCLSAILKLFGIDLGGSAAVGDDLPFRLRDDFLSAAELSFYRLLLTAMGSGAVVCPKVNLADLFFVVRPNENQGFRNKIDRKHVDFLLCHPTTMKPICGIELDDSSHARRDRQDRDQFVDQVFQVARLPLVRIPVKFAYSPTALLAMLKPHLSGEAVPIAAITPREPTESPICPKCGIPMVQRTAKGGPNAGQSFFGCPNYPKCRQVEAIESP